MLDRVRKHLPDGLARSIIVFSACAAATVHAAHAPDLTLRGTIQPSAHQTYRLVPFDVPEGVARIEVRFDYTGRGARTTIDLGLLGPGDTFAEAFRGWSGGNKRSFELSRSAATPSYLSGPITAGRWNLLLGIPNIRAGQVAEFTAEIYFERNDSGQRSIGSVTLRDQPGWYRGDLHLHSGHSDGSCPSKSGTRRVPCPLFLTLDAAAERHLDFVAITEHNTNSHVAELTALQPYFDRLLLIPGMEITTFQGHANAFNVTEPVDFRVGSRDVPDWNALLSALASRNTLVSINHPRVPSGEACMGCGWTPALRVDLSHVQAVEVVNGYDVETPRAGLPFWHEQLQKGYRLTAIGGSDTHDVTSKNALPPTARVGVPTTVVHAQALKTDAILAGIRAGAVFIDTAGTHDRLLEFFARVDDQVGQMGGELNLPRASEAAFTVRVANAAGGDIELIRDGTVLPAMTGSHIANVDYRVSFTRTGDGERHWLRVNVRDGQGRLVLIGNPIYINWPRSQPDL